MLDAETDVVTARIVLVSAERDQIVAAYQILGSIGRLTARDLVAQSHKLFGGRNLVAPVSEGGEERRTGP